MDRELFEHYLGDDSRRGAAPDGAFTGAAGGAACGDLSRISLTIADGRVASVSFDAEGCGATRAATAAVAETVEGATVLEAARVGIDEVDAAIGGLTPAKRHPAQPAAHSAFDLFYCGGHVAAEASYLSLSVRRCRTHSRSSLSVSRVRGSGGQIDMAWLIPGRIKRL